MIIKTISTIALTAIVSMSFAPQEAVAATKSEKAGAKRVSLFDGKTLKGWKPVTPAFIKYWSVVDGVIICSNGDQKMPTNTFLATEKKYKDFTFTCKFRLSGDHKTGFINSGIQYRSNIHPKGHGFTIVGYQADIGRKYWGDIYDEHRRGPLAKGNTSELFKNGFVEDGWHDYKIVCHGDRHQLFIDGKLTVDYTEKDTKFSHAGVIALQLHSGGVAKMEYKDINIVSRDTETKK